MATCLRLATSNASRSSSVLSALKKSNWRTRSIHARRELPYPPEGGLGKFLPPQALQTLIEYQDGLLERLNQELRMDPKAEKHGSVANIAIKYASKRERTLAFNYAVLALNNSFFLDQLSPPPEGKSAPNHEDKISRNLDNQIHHNYGDLTRLKSTFSAAAMGLFTNGWVWLVSDSEGHLGVLPTFGPSTLLVRSRTNMHYDDALPVLGEDAIRFSAAKTSPQLPNAWAGTFSAPASPASGVSGQNTIPNPFEFQSRTIHSSSIASFGGIYGPPGDSPLADQPASKPNIMQVGKTLFPLFCIPVYEHAWMSAGYGVWGKEPWLREFWSVLDWGKVSKAYAKHTSAKFS
ncbi:Manganese/iron superoxide dismutase [Flammula alnicola]|nr:Manganese/iron superoxide dismutase [Flammula alnicola]